VRELAVVGQLHPDLCVGRTVGIPDPVQRHDAVAVLIQLAHYMLAQRRISRGVTATSRAAAATSTSAAEQRVLL